MKRPSAAAAASRSGAQDRILAAVTELAGCHGYAHLTVERLLAQAGVSRATFYQYFSNVDDAFASAYRLHADELVAAVTDAAGRAEHPQQAMLQALIEIAQSGRNVAELLLSECLAAGAIGLSERDALISRIQDVVAHPGPKGHAIDIPVKVLIGATFRFLSMHLASRKLGDPRDELDRWARAFDRAPSQIFWSERVTAELPEDAPGSRPPATYRPGGGNPRERILHATAATIRASGYRATSVADIVSAAGISRRSFYNEFSNKAAAFIAAYELGFQQTLAACAPAFFSAEEWPEKVWQSALAFTSYFARQPSFAYLGFVECHSLGRGFADRVHETHLAFTLFLEEGFRQSQDVTGHMRTSSALTASAIAETGYLASRGSPTLYMRRMQPLAVYLALTPFIGSDDAGGFVAAKLSRPAAES
jgi:AcrR family transcriptional regulator